MSAGQRRHREPSSGYEELDSDPIRWLPRAVVVENSIPRGVPVGPIYHERGQMSGAYMPSGNATAPDFFQIPTVPTQINPYPRAVPFREISYRPPISIPQRVYMRGAQLARSIAPRMGGVKRPGHVEYVEENDDELLHEFNDMNIEENERRVRSRQTERNAQGRERSASAQGRGEGGGW